MTKYTIALSGDLLVGTAPDGDEARLQNRIDGVRQGGLVDIPQETLEIISGLTLYRTRDEAIDARDEGVHIYYLGDEFGHLEDEHGVMDYYAAGKLD